MSPGERMMVFETLPTSQTMDQRLEIEVRLIIVHINIDLFLCPLWVQNHALQSVFIYWGWIDHSFIGTFPYGLQ